MNGLDSPARMRDPTKVRGTEPGKLTWSNEASNLAVVLEKGTPLERMSCVA